MATWGGLRPANREEDAQNAVLTALKMKERLAAINERRNTLGIPPGGSGIGISYGTGHSRDYAMGLRHWYRLWTGDLRKYRFASANGHDGHRRYRQPRFTD